MKKFLSQTPMQWLVTIATIVTIGINVAANIVPFNGRLTGEISDRFKVFFIPSGYVFAIWGLIYLLLVVGIMAYQIFSKDALSKQMEKFRPLYLISAVANSSWIFAWHYGHYKISLGIMAVLLVSLIVMYIVVSAQKNTPQFNWQVYLPTSVYLGWISVATIANVTAVLYLLNFSVPGVADWIWACAMVVVAGILGAVMLIRYKDIPYAAVIVWALSGIAVKFPNTTQLAITAWTVSSILTAAIIITTAQKFNTPAHAHKPVATTKSKAKTTRKVSTPKKVVKAKALKK